MTYDLHMHSHFSDGQLSPLELMSLAKEKELSVCALTDHDTLNGLESAQQAAQGLGLTFINGVELSATWNKQLLHVVGLNIDPENDFLKQGIDQNTERRQLRAKAMLADFAKHGIDLEEGLQAQLPDSAVPTRPHFAQALIDLGKAKDKKQAFKRYLVKGKVGYIPMEWPSLADVASWIHAAGGVAVLAHPLRYKLTRTKLRRLLADMQECNMQGVEVSTAVTDKQQVDMMADLVQEYNLYASVGSDFHSLDQPWARLGGAKPLPKALKPVWDLF